MYVGLIDGDCGLVVLGVNEACTFRIVGGVEGCIDVLR